MDDVGLIVETILILHLLVTLYNGKNEIYIIILLLDSCHFEMVEAKMPHLYLNHVENKINAITTTSPDNIINCLPLNYLA